MFSSHKHVCYPIEKFSNYSEEIRHRIFELCAEKVTAQTVACKGEQALEILEKSHTLALFNVYELAELNKGGIKRHLSTTPVSKGDKCS